VAAAPRAEGLTAKVAVEIRRKVGCSGAGAAVIPEVAAADAVRPEDRRTRRRRIQ
jgi:hypothetical protein